LQPQKNWNRLSAVQKSSSTWKVKNKGSAMALETRQADTHPNQKLRRAPSLRSRIILGISITTIIASLLIGLLANYRNLSAQTFLGSELRDAVKERAEIQVQSLLEQEAQNIDQYFSSVNQAVISISEYTANLLDQNEVTKSGEYWDAAQKFTRLPNGAWDNPNEDLGAFFAPSFVELDENLVGELNSLAYLDFIIPNMLSRNSNITSLYFISKDDLTVYYPNIDLANILPADFQATKELFFTIAAPTTNPQHETSWTPPYQDPALTGLIVTNSHPVYDRSGQFRGIVGADIQLATITSRVLTITIGENGYAFLTDTEGRLIAMPERGYSDFDIVPENIPVGARPEISLIKDGPQNLRPVFQGMARRQSGLTRVLIHGIEHYLAYTPIPITGYSLGVIVPSQEMDLAYQQAIGTTERQNQATRNFGIVLLAVVITAAVFVGAGAGRWLTNPLNALTGTVQKIIAGDLTAQAPEISSDEIGILARAFNTMTTQLRETLENLEQRVAERTNELATANERIQRRVAQFEAVAQTARAISSAQDLETLLPKIANVISHYFNFYHTGIFLLDDNKDFAVLRASNSEGGRRMLERGHRLKVGEVGLVGLVTSRGQPRIALNTGADAIHFKNPDLPETRSELTLPLRIGDQIIGALDVQSTEPNAFSSEDVSVLSILADQVSTAIQNARLYEQNRAALAESQSLYRKFIQSGWRQYTLTRKLSGIRHTKTSSELLDNTATLASIETRSGQSVTMPLSIRGETIGEIHLQPPNNRTWGEEDLEIARALVERAAIAMENVRLLDEAQRRAAREQAIGEISANISTASDMESILRITVEELGRMMGGAEVVLELGTEKDEGVV
jgi:GAF domain-containing protein/HAMP domain-containing protein